ncbi:hypothetical protein Ahy_B01g053594 isoform A [Arachis hypogaea]|uniref:CCHC-type domain-containing protein n=1 Tax=Arachis hypogaea TaxID=3818 RepID=A0A445AS29_ARAHY|nr:hypothetical protein Ahy_B01g053594 isoform A [Arachis hypogaea]
MRDLQQLDQLKVMKVSWRLMSKLGASLMDTRLKIWIVELEFKSLNQFKDAIKEHALLNGQDIRFRKSDKVRCRVVCKGKKGKCKWMCFASKVGGSDYFRIKTLNVKHSCGRSYSGRLASSNWISKKIANNISKGEEMKLATVIQTIQEKYMANISKKEGKRRGTWADNPTVCQAKGLLSIAYLAIYGKSISPINGENMWPKTQCNTIIPPIFKVKAGRPRMVRIREPDENISQTKYRKIGTSITCNNCGQYGHNRRHCPNPIPPNTPAPPTQLPNTPAPPLQPLNTPVPPSQLATLPTPASQPPIQSTPSSQPLLPVAPASQSLSKTKVFGVNRSGRLKIGVRKVTSQPPEHLDLTLD